MNMEKCDPVIALCDHLAGDREELEHEGLHLFQRLLEKY